MMPINAHAPSRSLNILKSLLADRDDDPAAFREGLAGLIAHASTTRDIDEVRTLCVASMQALAREDGAGDQIGFGHRRALDVEAPAVVAKMENGRDFSLLVIDIDRLDDVNEIYGEAIGDQVTEAVAKAIAMSLRRKDILCRYGNGELIVIAPGMAGDGNPLAERLRLAVDRIAIRTETAGTLNARISIGAARSTLRDTIQDVFDKAKASRSIQS